MRAIAALFVAVLLSGCANQQLQQRQAEARQAMGGVQEELRAALQGNPKLEVLWKKINLLDPRQTTLQMLSSPDYVTSEDKQALEEWQGTVTALWPKFSSVMHQYYPWATPIHEALRAAGLTLVSDLYSGK